MPEHVPLTRLAVPTDRRTLATLVDPVGLRCLQWLPEHRLTARGILQIFDTWKIDAESDRVSTSGEAFSTIPTTKLECFWDHERSAPEKKSASLDAAEPAEIETDYAPSEACNETEQSLDELANSFTSHVAKSSLHRRRWARLQDPVFCISSPEADPPAESEEAIATAKPATLPQHKTAEPAEAVATASSLQQPSIPTEVDIALDLSAEWHLVAWLGQKELIQGLIPCDITAMIQSCELYQQKHSAAAPFWFQVLSSWLKDPGVIQTWTHRAPSPTAEPADVMNALFHVFQSLSTYDQKEVRRALRSGRGTGYMACLSSLGLIQKAANGDSNLQCRIRQKTYSWTQVFFN